MSYQNVQGIVPAINQIPNEIWWDVFDDLIEVPMFFATTYTGDNWTRDANESMVYDRLGLYFSLESQRKVIGSVCRSWQLWARSRRHRWVSLTSTQTEIGRYLEGTFKARRVFIMILPISWPVIQSVSGGDINWEIFSAHAHLVATFPPISPLRIRRICLAATGGLPSNPNTFLLALRRFIKDITWLDYETHGGYGTPNSIDPNTPDVIMPNLQVFYYRTFGILQLPLSYITMPSLRYLAIHYWLRLNDIPLNDIILAYGQTLQSVIIQVHSDYAAETVQFLPWNNLPRIEELVLSQWWSIQFEPIPPTHPLKKLLARHASFDALPSFIDAANMQKLLITGANWVSAGRLMLEGNLSKVQDVSALEEKARTRGIRFAITSSGEDEDKFITREE
jgi:hypothetical protein